MVAERFDFHRAELKGPSLAGVEKFKGHPYLRIFSQNLRRGVCWPGVGRVWAPTPPPPPRSHNALLLPLTIKLDSIASAMIEWRAAITLLLEASVRFPSNLRTLSHLQPRQRKANSIMTDTFPTTVNRTLRRLPNAAYRVREYLTGKEVDRLIEAARKRGRNGARDAAAILLAYRHGLRAQELCSLRWSQIDLRNGRLHVNRAKGGIESVHPLHGPELRALRPLQGSSPYVFITEAGTPVTTSWFLRMIQRTGRAAKLPFPVHPHMLRHSTGYKLANDGQDTRSLAHYLGHRNLQSTARYTALAPDRFAKFWRD
jgi:type 1 fimbriae regulatory protein FimB/type 1 fimbriae regulatory protein FimE